MLIKQNWKSILYLYILSHVSTISISFECTSSNGGEDYSGSKNKTVTGAICLPWTSTCSKNIADLVASSPHSFCRNPSEPADCHRSAPWCFISDSQWQYCDLPPCDVDSSTCGNALGLGNGLIKDEQIKASSFYSEGYQPKYARINDSNANFWMPNNYDQNYILINLTTPFRITKLYIQGTSSYYVKTFKILFSLNALEWTTYSQDGVNQALFTADTGPQIKAIYLEKPIEAIYFAILPITYVNFPALKLELFGCPSAVSIPIYTIITKNIESKVLWSYGGSPYVVRNMVTILPSASLTIDPKVKVIFADKEAGLKIQGCLISNGKRGFEIEFKSSNILGDHVLRSQQTTNLWAGLTFENLQPECNNVSLIGMNLIGGGLIVRSLQISIDGLSISNSQFGLSLPNVDPPTSLTLSNCVFTNNMYAISMQIPQITLISSSKFINNQYAIQVKSENVNLGQSIPKFTIDNTTLLNNEFAFYFLLYCNSYSYSISINNSQIIASSQYGLYVYSYCNAFTNISIENSLFSGSRISASNSNYGPVYVSLNNSIFENGSINGHSILMQGLISKMYVINSTFRYNQHTSLQILTNVDNSKIVIRDCLFLMNKNLQVDMLDIHFQNNLPTNLSLMIANNSFLENEMRSSLAIYDNSKIGTFFIERNIFANFLTKYELYIEKLWQPNSIIAVGKNYWNSTDKTKVLHKIYSFHSSLRQIPVSIETIYSDQMMTNLVNTSSWNVFSSEYLGDNKTVIAGGKILGGKIMLYGRDIVIAQSIHISTNATLVINSSSNISFAEGTGILIEGCLILNSSNGEISMRANNTNWQGIIFFNSNYSYLNSIRLNGSNTYAIDLINSSLIINNSIISVTKGILASGTGPSRLAISNSEIIGLSGETVIQFNSVGEVNLTLDNSVISQGYVGVAFQNCGRIFMTVLGTMFNAQGYASIKFYNSRGGGELNMSDSLVERLINFEYMHLNVSINNSSLGYSGSSNCLNYYGQNEQIMTLITVYNSILKCMLGLNIVNNYANFRINMRKNMFVSSHIRVSLNQISKFDFIENYFSTNLAETIPLAIELFSNNANQMYSANNNIRIDSNVYENINLTNNKDPLMSVVSLKCFNEYTSSLSVTANIFRNISAVNVICNDCTGLSLSKNIFSNPGSSYDLRMTPYSGQVRRSVYASGNYWNTQMVDSRVYDNLDDDKLLKVVVNPFYSDSNLTKLVNSETGFFNPNGLDIGGRITEDTTLVKKSGPYNVVSDIFIPFGKTLIIEKGVQMVFNQGGITAQGRLIVNGSKNEIIKMSSANENIFWKGIVIQQPLSNLIREHLNGWWEIYFNEEWRPLSIQSDYYKLQSADTICKQAGYIRSSSVTYFNCAVLSATEQASILFCNTTAAFPQFGVDCYSAVDNIQECNIYPAASTSNVANISCLAESLTTSSSKIYKIFSKDGSPLRYLNNSFNFKEAIKYQGEEFIFTSPCLDVTQNTDCVSIMLLSKPGWFLRVFINTILLEPEFSSQSNLDFKKSASFVIKKDEFIDSYYSIRFNNQYLAKNNDSLSLLNKVERSVEKTAVSFTLEQISAVNTKKKKVPTATLR